MIELLELSEKYTGSVSLDFQRYLMKVINWKNRLIGIKGARGTGKTFPPISDHWNIFMII